MHIVDIPTAVIFVPDGVNSDHGCRVAAHHESGRKERGMYAAIRQYHTDPGSIDEVVRRVNEDFVPVISDMPGFVAYFALNAGQGEFGTVSVFEDQDSAEESNRVAEEWVQQNLSSLLPRPQFAAGEVVAYKAT